MSMHEYVYADRILQTVLADAEAAQRKPVRVDVEVGELLGLTKESLSMAYEILSKGTRAEGSKLRTKIAEGSLECGNCGFNGRIPHKGHQHVIDPAFACPECGAPLRVNSGLEVKLEKIGWEGGPVGKI
jgi:hydrogenase nickel incorporation protein HypA/HybF